MRRLVLVGVLASLVLAGGASAADPQVAALKKQVAALQKQVNALKKSIANVNSQLTLNFEGDTCLGAQTADLFQGTWLVIDQVAGHTIFGQQTPTSDFGNCANLAQPDVPRPGIRNPPTIAPFLPLLQWLHVPLQ
jgi:hypothetical protein